MFRTVVTRRTFTTSTLRRAEDKSLGKQAAEMAKKAAGAFKADGAVGKEFNADGSVGGTAQEVGGPFSADGSVGKQFTKDGAVGGTGQKVAEKGQEMAEEKKPKV